MKTRGPYVVRHAKSRSLSLDCADGSGTLQGKCKVKLSIRGTSLAICIHGGDEWAHLEERDVHRLSAYLGRALTEIQARKEVPHD